MENFVLKLYFFVYLISGNYFIPIQTLICSSSFIKIPMPITSIAVLVLLQRSILRDREKLNSFQLFLSFTRFQVFSTISESSLNRKVALKRKFSWLGLQQSVAIADDIVQEIWIKRVMFSRSSVNIQNRILVWVSNSFSYLFYENVELSFGQKYTLTSRLREKGVKI